MTFDRQALKEVYIRLGHRIRHSREALGMSQEELGQRVGLGVARVQACEEGRQVIRIGLIAALATALDISASDLLHDEEAGEVRKGAEE
ncbi:MAG TPA: helix-turn-helix transcriptional regulator [Dongiaceae bacterium]|jgi:transcriptional regulator with XRE-family HTH domain|nr:helix-turn-helix transcriptional regulator [Dongiaceae bacterium]